MTNSQIFTAAHKLAKTFEGNYSACLKMALIDIYFKLKTNPIVEIKKSEFKSDNQLTIELLERCNVKAIFETVDCLSSIGETLLQLVKDNSTNFTQSIAERGLSTIEFNFEKRHQKSFLSTKQSWCIAFQIKENIELYKSAMNAYNNMCLAA